jgi:Ca2+-binding EF-hand superfamily protein
MNIVLRYNNISKIVADKVDKANFDAMLALYRKRACPLEAQCFARLVGSADKETDLEEFERQARHAFQKIIRQQQKWGIEPEKGKEELLFDKLRARVIDQRQNAHENQEAKESGGEHAMTGVSLLELCSYMKKHDENGDGSIDFDEFLVMIEEARSLANIFTGSEKAPPLDETLDQSETLSDFQIETLLLYPWPKAHDSSGQDDLEGLGGLATVVKGSIGKKNTKDFSKNPKMMDAMEDRKANISAVENTWLLKPNFNRQDQQLVTIADMVDVLKKLEKIKQLPSWYQKHDWKEEIRKALKLYIEDTDGRTPSDPNAPSEKLQTLLNAIKVRTMSKKEKLEALYNQARRLIKEGVTAIPPLVWSKHGEDDDNDIVHVIDGLQKLAKEYRDLSHEDKKEIKKVVTIYEAEKLAEEMKTDPESHTKEACDAAVKDLEQKLKSVKELERKQAEQGDTNGRKPSKHSASSEKVGLVHTRALLRSSQALEKLVREVKDRKEHSWSLGETRAQRDNHIINRLGFLFVAYRVEFWFELPWEFPRSPLTPCIAFAHIWTEFACLKTGGGSK